MIDEARVPPLLRRHEVGRAEDGASHRLAVVARLSLCEPEIRKLWNAVLREKHVCRFNVAMDDAEVMGLRQAVAELAGKVDRVLQRHRPITAAVEQAAAIHKLHDQKRPVFRLAVIVDLDDVRVIQSGDRLGFG